jgi:putative ABC transport system permease protein
MLLKLRRVLTAVILLIGWIMDVRYAWRSLLRAPGFSVLVIATFAIGIGATMTMFSAVWAVFLRPLPFPHQERLVTVWQVNPKTPDIRQRVVPANFVDWQAQSQSFDALGVLPNWTGEVWPFNVVRPGGVERVSGIYASSGFFRVMGVAPLLGATFASDDDLTPGRRHAIISQNYWERQLNANPSVIGSTITIDTFRGGAFTIVGVMPRSFDFPRSTDIWLSLADWGGGPMPPRDSATERCCPWYTVFGRLKPGVPIAQARSELATIATQVSQQHPEASTVRAEVVPLREALVGSHRTVLFGLFGAVGCILLIGCANVANLLLTRGVARRREAVTRFALGATKWRLARQLLMESLMLGALGSAFGVLISMWAQDLVRSVLADRVPYIDETHLDSTVLLFAIVLTVTVSAVCGLLPLIDWRGVEWNARGQTEARSSRRVRHALVVGEVALAITLVATAGLLVRSVANLKSVNVGFETTRTLVMKTDLTLSTLRQRGASAQFIHDVIIRVAAMPGVRAVGATTGVPFESGPAEQAITREGAAPRPANASPQVIQSAVTPDFFKALGIATIRGRSFTEDDRADGRLVAVINQTAARRYWPGEDPLGKRFAIGSRERFGGFRAVKPGEVEWREIVGVVADVRSAGFANDVQPEVFYNYRQLALYDPSIVVRTTGDPASLVQSVRDAMHAVNDRAVITRVRTLDEIANASIADPRLRATVASMFSAVALLLGMLGLYGLMAYTVTQQTREIGIRMALGAARTQVAQMVIGKALKLTLGGAVLGLATAYAGSRYVSGLLFGVTPTDPATLVGACLVLMTAAMLASLVPTRRATRVDPAITLRDE